MSTRTYKPVDRTFPPRYGVLVTDGAGKRVYWWTTKRRRDAEMDAVRQQATQEANQ